MTQSAQEARLVGLRELKKARTRESLRLHALRLFDQQGYDATTLEQVAAAAEVSPRTLYRYFPTKEDLVFADDDDPWVLEVLRHRPQEEPDLVAVREAMRAAASLLDDEAERAAAHRLRFAMTTPGLRARATAERLGSAEEIARVLGERNDLAEPDLACRAVATAALGAISAALESWASHPSGSMADSISRGIDALIAAAQVRPIPMTSSMTSR
jgi:AcrR family transcriptional regulator